MPELSEWQPDYPVVHTMAEKLRQFKAWADRAHGGTDAPSISALASNIPLSSIADTLDRIAYGERLTMGRGQTLQTRPETVDTALRSLAGRGSEGAGYTIGGKYYDTQKEIKTLEDAINAKRDRPSVVRFADPDTVAKVEGWSTERDHVQRKLDDAERRLFELKEQQRVLDKEPAGPNEPDFRKGFRLDRARKVQIEQENINALKDALKLAKTGKEGLLYDEHRGIYQRYESNLVPYFRQLGGKHVTDQYGHGWWEVPVSAKRDVPTRLFQVGALGTSTYGMLAPPEEEN